MVRNVVKDEGMALSRKGLNEDVKKKIHFPWSHHLRSGIHPSLKLQTDHYAGTKHFET